MTREELMKAVDLTDDRYIAEAAVPPAKKNSFPSGVKAALAVAACLAVFLLAGLILKNGTMPTYTDAPTSDGFSVSRTEKTTTEKTTEPTEEPTAEIVVPPSQSPTEPPTEEPSAQILRPSSETTSADVTEPTTEENTSPTAPPEQQTAETTAEEPATEPTTEPTTAEEPTGKTLGDILSVFGWLDSIAGEGELLGEPEQSEEQVFTELTEEDITEIFSFSPSGRIVIPDGYAQEGVLFGKTEENGRETFQVVYAFAKETDIVYLALQKGDTAFSPELFDSPPVNINGTDVYLMTEYDEYSDTPELYRNCLAAFERGGLMCVVFGSGVSVTPEELLLFSGNLLSPA